ncbi:DUF6007 family protein [Bacillus altitudinis]|uniref:DUF6007 family protein n=1 Tax=Bacillus altitudinis TaxID=293387 RepID=UPI0011A2A061|nr:DUF6007 family protein [Bacillus altitudinis]MCY7718441.1 DUF6007 family protein [Bacillus altitudinis]MDR7671079.1 DUF6007 family protein [Bacillus altitudinis]
MDKQKDDLYEVFKHISILEVLFFIPASLLFFYLPVNNFISIILNVAIVILSGIGTSAVYRYSRKLIKRKKESPKG